MVTTTFTAPAVCAAVVAVIEVLLTTATLVDAVPPKLTLAPDRNPVPVMVTAVPPAVLPEVGEIADTVGAGFVFWPAALMVTNCITQFELAESVAVALYAPAVVTFRSSTRFPRKLVSVLKPLPAVIIAVSENPTA